MEQVKVTLKKGGLITVEVSGAEGSTCEAITKALISKLGTEKEVDLKDEFFATWDVHNHNKQ
jgi:hypothetical protein